MSRTILGQSTAVKNLLGMIGKVAGNKTNVLIIGESGTGKELVARMIHESGPLKGKPFVPVNCGAIPETLIESEMFGHKKGSFTGAISDKIGLFEAANGGTLFLDEVGELPLSMQVKLLRSLQERVIRRVGGNDDIKVDVRIISATNRDLEAGIAKGTFREDLFYRLNVILIKTPPLRDRHGDIEILATAFLKKFAEKQKKEVMSFSPDALQALLAYHWPGNIRELENVVERAVTLESGEFVSFASLPSNVTADFNSGKKSLKVDPSALSSSASGLVSEAKMSSGLHLPQPDFSRGPIQLDDVLADVERHYLTLALEHTGGVKKKAAEMLGMTFRSIRYRLAKLGLEKDDGEEN
jgi:two-component system response regulator PilR (NtrC family)